MTVKVYKTELAEEFDYIDGQLSDWMKNYEKIRSVKVLGLDSNSGVYYVFLEPEVAEQLEELHDTIKKAAKVDVESRLQNLHMAVLMLNSQLKDVQARLDELENADTINSLDHHVTDMKIDSLAGGVDYSDRVRQLEDDVRMVNHRIDIAFECMKKVSVPAVAFLDENEHTIEARRFGEVSS